jgi:hypothetical protein
LIWSTTKFNSSSTLVLFTSLNPFALFIMATPSLIKSWWIWLSSTCYGKNLYSFCGIIPFCGGCKFS